MIIRPRLHWFRMLFVLRGSVLPDIFPQLVAITAFSVAVTWAHGQFLGWKVPLNFVPFSLVGLTLAIFLGFRNSTSYARFWEARALWGTVLNETRSLVRHALTLPSSTDHARELTMVLVAFVHALKHQLRCTDPAPELVRVLPKQISREVMSARYVPAILLLCASKWVRRRREEGVIEPVLIPLFEEGIGRLNDALGGCERIAGTPIPFTYSVLIHRTVFAYCVLLPFGLVDSIGTMTPVISAFLAYTFLGLEAVAAEIEEPFGIQQNDLALDAMSSMIEETLRELIGEVWKPKTPRRSAVQQV